MVLRKDNDEIVNYRMLLRLGVGTSLIYLAFLAPGIYAIDGNSMLAVAESLVLHHSVVVPPGLGVVGRGGNVFSSWYPLLSFLAVPFVAIALALAHLFHLPAHFVAAVCALILPALLSGATASIVALLALRLGSTWRGAWLAAIAYSMGTIALVYARTFFAEPLLAFLTAAGLCLTLDEMRRDVFGSSICSVLAVLTKPTGIVLGPILSAYLLAKRRPIVKSLFPFFGTVAGLAVYFAYNYYRFSNALNFGQPGDFSLATIPAGLTGLLVSPGRGLVWYCPCIVLALVGFRAAMRMKPIAALAVAMVFLGYLAIHSLWKFWPGGWSWGPRFLLPALPGLAALLGLLEGKWVKVLVLLTSVGFFVNAPTLVTFYERYYAEASAQGIGEHALLWSPRDAPLLHEWGAADREIHDAESSDVREIMRSRGNPADSIESSRALRVVAVWWWVLPIAHISRWLGAGVALILVVIGVILIVLSRVGGTETGGQRVRATAV